MKIGQCERAEPARQSVNGCSVYGNYATAVLEAVRETTVGNKTELTRDLVESPFSRLGEAALTAKYFVGLALDADFPDSRR